MTTTRFAVCCRLTTSMMMVVAAGLTALLLTTHVFPGADALPATWSASPTVDGESSGLACDFEDQLCRWQWSSRFVRRSAAEINATIYTAPDPAMISGPLDDADGRPTGTCPFSSFCFAGQPELFHSGSFSVDIAVALH